MTKICQLTSCGVNIKKKAEYASLVPNGKSTAPTQLLNCGLPNSLYPRVIGCHPEITGNGCTASQPSCASPTCALSCPRLPFFQLTGSGLHFGAIGEDMVGLYCVISLPSCLATVSSCMMAKHMYRTCSFTRQARFSGSNK